MSQPELSQLIFDQLQESFAGTRERINFPASNYNRDLANKLSTGIFDYLDTIYWARITAYVDTRIADLVASNQTLAAQVAQLQQQAQQK